MSIRISDDGGILISHATLAAWAGFDAPEDLTPDIVAGLARALPYSSVPEAISEIVGGMHTDHSDTRVCQGIGCEMGDL